MGCFCFSALTTSTWSFALPCCHTPTHSGRQWVFWISIKSVNILLLLLLQPSNPLQRSNITRLSMLFAGLGCLSFSCPCSGISCHLMLFRISATSNPLHPLFTDCPLCSFLRGCLPAKSCSAYFCYLSRIFSWFWIDAYVLSLLQDILIFRKYNEIV